MIRDILNMLQHYSDDYPNFLFIYHSQGQGLFLFSLLNYSSIRILNITHLVTQWLVCETRLYCRQLDRTLLDLAGGPTVVMCRLRQIQKSLYFIIICCFVTDITGYSKWNVFQILFIFIQLFRFQNQEQFWLQLT